MKKFLIIFISALIIGFGAFYAFVYFFSFSEGDRAGKLVKISKKGVLFKTYEGIISQGVAGEQTFLFSVLDNQEESIEMLKSYQGQHVKLHYKERFRTFAWWGDTRYFVTDVTLLKGNNNTISTNSNFDTEEEIKELKARVRKLEEIIEEL